MISLFIGIIPVILNDNHNMRRMVGSMNSHADQPNIAIGLPR